MAGEQFIFAGIVDEYYERSVNYFQKEVKPLIDGNQIRYLGPADLKLKNELLGGAKAFLNPIDWDEPFGMVIVESMACGTPLISYARGAAPEIIKHGENGFLVSNKNEMLKFLTKVRKIDRQKCRQHVEDQFSPKVAAAKYLNLYRREIQLHTSLGTDTVLPPSILGSILIESPKTVVNTLILPSFRKKILSSVSD